MTSYASHLPPFRPSICIYTYHHGHNPFHRPRYCLALFSVFLSLFSVRVLVVLPMWPVVAPLIYVVGGNLTVKKL